MINEIRKAGARIRLISDGDLSPGVAAAMLGSGVHAVMGTGGAPEGVITAAAIRCLNGYMVGRLVGYTPEQGERMKDMGISDPKRIYTADELAPGKNIIFSATGVTDGPLLKGVRFFGDGVRTSSLVMKLNKSKVRFIETIHVDKRAGREGQNSGAVRTPRANRQAKSCTGRLGLSIYGRPIGPLAGPDQLCTPHEPLCNGGCHPASPASLCS